MPRYDIRHTSQLSNSRELIIKETHRGLWYEDGVFQGVLDAGRYLIPKAWPGWMPLPRRPLVEIVSVDVREQELTIKGQEILTADKVAIRVSIIVQFRVVDPRLAVHAVANYSDRLYSDVQLAARRSLATMTLEEILTNRNRLSEDILADVKEAANSYGVAIYRADVKDLIFPGNLQEIMNKVLAAERMAEARLVESRTTAETQRIEANARAEVRTMEAEANARTRRLEAESQVEAQLKVIDAQIESVRRWDGVVSIYDNHPALLRLQELDALRELSKLAQARIYIGFDKHARTDDGPHE